MRTTTITLVLFCFADPLAGLAGDAYQKGSANCDSCWHHHHRNGGRRGDSTSRSTPSGSLATDQSFLRAAPTAFVMPVMTMRAVTPESGANWASDGDRLDELDARIEAIHLRLSTVQRAVELQTMILEELKTKGTIGGQQPGVSVVVPPSPPPPAPAAAKKEVQEKVAAAQQALEAYKQSTTPDATLQAKIDEVLELLKQYEKANE